VRARAPRAAGRPVSIEEPGAGARRTTGPGDRTEPLDTDLLDNPVWHSIAGPHGELAERRRHAGRFLPAVSPFAAVADGTTPEAWQDLAALVRGDGIAVLFRRFVAPPSSWTVTHRLAAVQMVAEGPAPTDVHRDEVVTLGPDDVPEMLALAHDAQPGPFESRTVEFGSYLGIRDGGRLVAMAGERLRISGYTEISAVCTDERHRGRGLATRLVVVLMDQIRGRGEQAFLHVATTNGTAIRLYESLGFTTRCAMEALVLVPPPTAPIAR
jgi:ribosomal protein S18 acetylase RimI-like enzyme